jgi:hypothetical protein
MYKNIGKKMKGLAKGIFIIESILAVLAGIVLILSDDDLILTGFLVMILLPIAAWISSWLLYGFGEIIDRLQLIEKNTRPATNEPSAPVHTAAQAPITPATPSFATEGKIASGVCPRCKEVFSYSKDDTLVVCPFCHATIAVPHTSGNHQ